MDKGSAPPMEQSYQQGAAPMDAPPSYDQSMAHGGPAGPFVVPGGAPPAGGMYPPLPPENKMMGPPPAQQPHTTVVTQVQYVTAPVFGHRPVTMVCPHCQQNITTSTDSEPSAMAYVISAVLCIVGLWPCACVPCCIDSLQTVRHKCPSCRKYLGSYKGGL